MSYEDFLFPNRKRAVDAEPEKQAPVFDSYESWLYQSSSRSVVDSGQYEEPASEYSAEEEEEIQRRMSKIERDKQFSDHIIMVNRKKASDSAYSRDSVPVMEIGKLKSFARKNPELFDGDFENCETSEEFYRKFPGMVVTER